MDDIYKLAISFIKGVGDIGRKNIVNFFGEPEAVFSASKSHLLKVPNIGRIAVSKIDLKEALDLAKRELEQMTKYDIKFISYLDSQYPSTLYNCPDSPCVLYYKGKFDLANRPKISIVGTRKATNYGKALCEEFISELKQSNKNPIIISGLAYGIDICAHKAALKNNLDTSCVLGHGLNLIYPAAHKNIADQIQLNSSIISEFNISDKFDSRNFVKRNRIIAGLADAVVVIESDSKGGSLVTANIANSYNKDVFAYPGRIGDRYSSGCNFLIKTNQAHLIESLKDLSYILGWDDKEKENTEPIMKLFDDYTKDEKRVIDILKVKENLSIDNLTAITKMPASELSSILLKLEFDGIIVAVPGKIYSFRG
jgi:DNA processing protein